MASCQSIWCGAVSSRPDRGDAVSPERCAVNQAKLRSTTIVGERRRLGLRISATSVRTILRRHDLGPAPRRGGPSWTQSCAPKPLGRWPVTF